MTRAFNQLYLDDAQYALGAMLDYAVNTCGQDLSVFYARFLSSGIAGPFSRANPKYMGLSGIELALLVAQRTGDPLPLEDAFVDVGSPEFWTGWALAYLCWNLNVSLETLQQRGVTAEMLCSRFNPLHEAPVSTTAELAKKRLRDSLQKDNPLKRQRAAASLTQQDLARLSGHSLRAIRAWEQGQRSLSCASADGIRRLCRVLGCRMEDLI